MESMLKFVRPKIVIEKEEIETQSIFTTINLMTTTSTL